VIPKKLNIRFAGDFRDFNLNTEGTKSALPILEDLLISKDGA